MNSPTSRPMLDRTIRPMLVVGGGIIGGVEEHVLSLVKAFLAWGYEPFIVAPFAGVFTRALQAIGHPPEHVAIVDMGDRVNVAGLAHLVWLCQTRGITIVHSHMRGADLVAAPAAARAGLPALSSLHGLERYTEELLLHELYDLQFLAVSEAGRQSAIDIGLPPEGVPVVRNGIDATRFDPRRFDRVACRRALDIDDDTFLIAAISRLMPEKDPMAAVDVARRLSVSHPRARILLAGTGTLEAQVRQAAETVPAIAVLGPRLDVPEILAASDLLLLTSKRESLPLAVLEGMSMALPIVSFDVGGVGEAVDETCGRLIAPGDIAQVHVAIGALIDDSTTRRALGVAGRARVLERFTQEHCAAGVIARYEELVARASATATTTRRAGALAGMVHR